MHLGTAGAQTRASSTGCEGASSQGATGPPAAADLIAHYTSTLAAAAAKSGIDVGALSLAGAHASLSSDGWAARALDQARGGAKEGAAAVLARASSGPLQLPSTGFMAAAAPGAQGIVASSLARTQPLGAVLLAAGPGDHNPSTNMDEAATLEEAAEMLLARARSASTRGRASTSGAGFESTMAEPEGGVFDGMDARQQAEQEGQEVMGTVKRILEEAQLQLMQAEFEARQQELSGEKEEEEMAVRLRARLVLRLWARRARNTMAEEARAWQQFWSRR